MNLTDVHHKKFLNDTFKRGGSALTSELITSKSYKHENLNKTESFYFARFTILTLKSFNSISA